MLKFISFIFLNFFKFSLPLLDDKQNRPIKYTLILTDVAGQHDYDRLREPAYKNVDVFVVCYSCVYPSSYENIKQVWLPEIIKFN